MRTAAAVLLVVLALAGCRAGETGSGPPGTTGAGVAGSAPPPTGDPLRDLEAILDQLERDVTADR